MKDFVVYTAITDGYDTLSSPPEQWHKHADFVAFLETPQNVPGWEIRPIYNRFHDPCRNAKIHKILPHKYFPKARYSLWIDGSVRIISTLPLESWPNTYLCTHDLAVFKHHMRWCAYQEAAACIDGKLDSFSVINRQMNKYAGEGYPYNNGLAECTILFRRHTRQIKCFNEAWYNEIKTYSRRDQLSFNYVADKVKLPYRYLPGSMLNNPHFDWLPHTKSRLP